MKLDRRKTYYKVIKEDGQHHGMTYKEGLNVDVLPFNDYIYHVCCAGRIYITTKEHIHRFLEHGDFIWEVKLPKDTKWIDEGNKIGVDRLFLKNPEPIWKFCVRNNMISYLIINEGKNFSQWWYKIKNKINQKDVWRLPTHCAKHFHIWWHEVKHMFNKDDVCRLYFFCLQYFNIWWYDIKNKFDESFLIDMMCYFRSQGLLKETQIIKNYLK